MSHNALQIVYEDDDLVVVNKPAGLLTHPVNREDTSDSVAGWLLKHYPDVAGITDAFGEQFGVWTDLRRGIVHRLDRETSGVLVAAKTQQAFDYLKNLFKGRKIKKVYLVLVYGRLKNKEGVIELPLGKLGAKQSTRVKGKKELEEKEAITEYCVVKEFEGYSLLEVYPKTGRMHQIRIHLKSVGHPVVCDQLYNSKNLICPPELGRMFLHAIQLQFVTPSHKALTIEVDLPPELDSFLATLRPVDGHLTKS